MSKWVIRIIFLFLAVRVYAVTNDANSADIKTETKEYFTPKAQLLSYDENIEPFSFAVISDPHSSEKTRVGYEKFGTAREKLQLCLKEINKLKEPCNPEFVLITGDIHLAAIKDLLADFNLPVHLIAGNHETKEQKKILRAAFPNDFNQSDYYSFSYKNARFIGICDAICGDHVGHLSSDDISPPGQSRWLENELKKEEKIKVIFGHIPPQPNSDDESMWLSRNDSLFFNDLVKRTKPTVMFFGHQHRTAQISLSGCEMHIVRSSSWNLYNAPIGFLLVSINKDGISVKEITFK